MREKRTIQPSIFEIYPEHDIGRELKAMSKLLDAHPDLLDWVAADIKDRQPKATGRKGLSVDTVLRCAILKQYRQLSYEELVFCLMDSSAYQAFARLCGTWVPKKSALQRCISAISAVTWEQINLQLLEDARQDKIENSKMLRIDSTVTESTIHDPTDGRLLWDSVRVLIRLMEAAQDLPGAPELTWQNHQRVAKKRMRSIIYTRGADKKARLYRDLIKVTRNSLCYVEQADLALRCSGIDSGYAEWSAQVAHYQPLIEKVIEQAERRVFQGEKVPANEKIVSLFEEHTDIIVKGRRDIQYGHKLNLSTGRSGLILDVVVEKGNPADSAQFLPMLERHIEHFGVAPRQMAADGGYASTDNLQAAKALQVKDVVFHKKRGLKVEDMAQSPWVYRKLRNFRAGIEAGISCLKRAYGLSRCTWKGWAHFEAYVWSSVVAHNLALFGRLKST
ncbi:ISNCY family transposase [Thiolapillus sp.]|uniref:ISNCY family transposase n=1 Tax=Thiolapillus sp. TaxID=2017437 RepID=UPI003AF79E59